MLSRILASSMALVLVGPTWAQRLSLPAEIKADVGAFVRVAADTDCADVQWFGLDGGLNLFPVDLLKDSKTAVVVAAKAGRFRLLAYGAKGDKASAPAVCTVVVGTPEPTPPPVPPGPPPGPTPVAGLHALIVYETADATRLPPAQQAVIFGRQIRDWLNAHTPAGPDGKTHQWRIYDKDVDASAEAKVWQDWVKRPRQSVPWIVLGSGDGTVAFEGPLPASVDDALKLLARFGG